VTAAIVERLKEERIMYGLSARMKKVAVIERWPLYYSGGSTVPGTSPLRWLTKLEVKSYKWWPIFIRVVVTVGRSRANVKIMFPMEKKGMHGQFLPVLECSLT